MKRFLFLFVAVVFLDSCGSDETEVTIDDSLLPYFEEFAKSAESRGIEVDYAANGISAVLSVTDQNIAGQCFHNSNNPNKIVISSSYWKSSSSLRRRFVVFHELGHCMLNRAHLDTKNSGGQCTSIMHSGEDVCIFDYGSLEWETYLDELFKP